MKSIRVPKWFVAIVAVFFAGVFTTTDAQEMDRFVQNLDHIFKNQDDEIVADGTFVKVLGGRIVVEEDGEEIKVLISSLCEEDQAWVKKMSKAQKARESARKKFAKILEDNLNSGTESRMASGLASIRKLGKNAAFASSTVERYTGDSFPEKVRYQAFMATIATKFSSEAGFRSALNMVIQDRPGVMEKVAKSPGDFMMAMATFEEYSLPYLQLAAYSGQLIPEDLNPIPPTDAESTLDRDQVKVRTAAVAALASLPGEDTLQMVLEVLEAAENPDEGETDSTTIRACLTAIGKMGMRNESVEDKLSQHEEEFASQVKTARERIAKAQKSEDEDN